MRFQCMPCPPSCAALGVFLLATLGAAQPNIDGGRSELPGMKQDMFDRVNQQKKAGARANMGKGPPECPKSDGLSPFYSLAFVSGEMFVRLNSTEGQCVKLLTIGGANYTTLVNASKTCGPYGEYKRRIAENISTVFFQGEGLEWPKSEGSMIEVVTEEGTFEVDITEAKYAKLLECWTRGCECEQAKNPIGRLILCTLGALMAAGLFWDSGKVAYEQIVGKKPDKHVMCKRGHRVKEGKFCYSHLCDVCGKSGTGYACTHAPPCNYDLCKVCYKKTKTKLKEKMKLWLEKHPEDKKSKKDKDDEDDDDKAESEKNTGADSEPESRADSTVGSKDGGEGKESGKDSATEPEDDKEDKTEE